MDGEAQLLHRRLEDRPTLGVELQVHQVGGLVDEVDLEAVVEHPPCRLQTEQPSSDDGHPAVAVGVAGHLVAVVDRAEAEDACLRRPVGPVQALEGREEGAAPGGDDQLVVRHGGAVVGEDLLRPPVDLGHPDAGVQRDAVVPVPRQRVEEDVGGVVQTGEHPRQQDPVVVPVGLVTEHGGLEQLRAPPLQDLFDRARPGHPVADDNQPIPLGLGDAQTSTSPMSMTAKPDDASGAARWTSRRVSESRSSTTRRGTWLSALAPRGK